MVKGDILKVVGSDDGRWILTLIKLDNYFFILCNIYGYTSHPSNKQLFSHITVKIKELLLDYRDSHIILGGDFNECMDDVLDRYLPRPCNVALRNNLILSLCSDLWLMPEGFITKIHRNILGLIKMHPLNLD